MSTIRILLCLRYMLKGSGIGRATAVAFAAAGAERLIIIGRTEASLQETASLVSLSPKVEVCPASVTNDIQVGERDR